MGCGVTSEGRVWRDVTVIHQNLHTADSFFFFRYLWAVESRRSDVAVIDQNLLTAVWFTRAQGHLFQGLVFPHRYGMLSAYHSALLPTALIQP